MSSKSATLIAFSVAMAATSAAAQSLMSQNNEVLMAVGDPVPGLPGVTIMPTSNFDAPVMDQNGTVLFRARFTGAGVTATDDRGYFLGRSNGDLRLVVRAGDQAPGLPAGILLRNSINSAGINGSPRISPFGEILFFQSALYDPINPGNTPTTADTAFFWGPAGNIIPLAREGDQVPFLAPGVTWGSMAASLQSTQINASGIVLFQTSVLGTTAADDGLLVTGLPGMLSIVAREGDVLPGGEVVIPVSGTTQLSFITQLNAAGQVLHELRFATTAPSTATTANDRALAIWTAGTDTIIAREGQQAPGLPTGVLFATPALSWTPAVGGAAFTNSGKTVFNTPLDGGGTVVGVNDRACYFGDMNGMTLVLRRGDAAPGLSNGELFGVNNDVSTTCNESQVAFINTMTGPSVTTANDSSMWVGSPGNLTMIAREGDVVPASILPPSVNGPWVYQAINGGSNNPLLNGRGDVLFQASVGDSVNTKNVQLAWINGLGMRLVLDSTDTFTTSAGPSTWTVLVTNAGFNSADGGQSHFNNNGDFAVKPGLTTGTAAIVRGHVGSLQANPAAISASAGGTHTWSIDCGPAQANLLYIVIGSMSGTRPGFPSPLGPQTIPLNFDAWTQLSLDLANTGVFTNSLWFLDGNGKGTASFNLPPALPGAQGLNLHHAVVALTYDLASTFVSEPAALRLY
jgi:hypothetical protein